MALRIDAKEALKPINHVIREFGSGAKNVRDVINTVHRDIYKASIPAKARADHSKTLPQPVALISGQFNPTPSATAAGQPHNRYIDPRKRRHVVIPGTVIAIDSKRFNRQRCIFEELRHIELRDRHGHARFPNAAVLLLRLFLEASVDTYIKQKHLKHPSPKGWKDVSLTHRVRAVSRHLHQAGTLIESALEVINKNLGDPNKHANPDSLNSYAHNMQHTAHPSDITSIWDTYKPLFETLWDALR